MKKFSIAFGTTGSILGLIFSLLIIINDTIGLPGGSLVIAHSKWTLFANALNNYSLYLLLAFIEAIVSIALIFIIFRCDRFTNLALSISTSLYIIIGSPNIIPVLLFLSLIFAILAKRMGRITQK